jgi:hypothetical protein
MSQSRWGLSALIGWVYGMVGEEASSSLKPICPETKLKLDKLEERLVPAGWGLPITQDVP